jgi:hypothetical protein
MVKLSTFPPTLLLLLLFTNIKKDKRAADFEAFQEKIKIFEKTIVK